MKILITLPVKIGFDGMTKQILSYGQYMDKTDVELDLLSCRGFDPNMKKIIDNAGFDHIYRMEYRDTNQIKYFLKLLKLMHKNKYDVIHANGQSATLAVEMLAAKLSGCKIRIAHSHSSKCIHQKAHKLLKPLFKITYNDAIACSKEAGDWLFEGEKYWILKNGIDVNKFTFNLSKRKEYRKILDLNDNEVAVGHVGAFEPWKNQTFLIDIFEKINKNKSNYKLFLFGIDGSTKDKILNRINDKKLQDIVIFKGTTDEIFNYLQAMDLMVLPSWYEGFPVTVVEWQTNGLPCIVSDTISKSVNLNGLVKFLPIDQGSAPWIEEISKYNSNLNQRANRYYPNAIRTEGYDITHNANELKNHYIKKLEELE